MTSRALVSFSCAALTFAAIVATANAAKISGTISSTMTISEDSQLVGDVTCTVSGGPCLDVVAGNVTLDLSGFTMTGQADAQTGCAGGNGSGTEHGIRILNQTGVTVRGPGIIQRFRNDGIIVNASTGTTITGVTTSTNCNSGILVAGTLNILENNISIRNGNSTSPCGGI